MIVVLSPVFNECPRLCKISEPVLVQAFIADFIVQTFGKAILLWLATFLHKGKKDVKPSEMMKKIYTLVAMLLVATAVAFVFYQARSEPPKTRAIKVGYLAIGAGLPTFVAKKNGYFSEQGFEVELVEFKTSNDIAAAGLSGSIDVVALGATNAFLDANSNAGGKFSLFLTNNYVRRPNAQSTDFVIAREGSGINSFAGFKGKTVAIFPGSVGEVFFKAAVPKLGLSTADVKTVSMAPPQWMPALKSGSIDGVFGALEPFATQILSSGSGVIIVDGFYAEVMPSVPASASWFIAGKLTKEEEKKYVKAMQKAVAFITSNEAAARIILGDYIPTPKEQLSDIRLQEWKFSEEAGTKESALQFAEIFHANGGITALPNSEEWIWKP
jgi:ABC-type nitrate/sulfonate/bicarbonate transport system substrate-binding protein